MATTKPRLTLVGVEGWRGVAALLVVTMHVWANQGHSRDGLGPWMNVHWWAVFAENVDAVLPIFFVLSGLLIWLPFAVAGFDSSRPIPHGGVFMIRRSLRFLPLYFLVVLVMWCRHNYNPFTADWLDLLEHLTFTQCFDSKRIFYTIGPAWTLSVEWYFYISMAIFAPSIVRWMRHGRAPIARMSRFMVIPLAVVAVSVSYRYLVAEVWHVPVTSWAWRYGPLAKADSFAIGMILATLIVTLRGKKLPVILFPILICAAAATYRPAVVPAFADHNTYNEVWRHTLMATSIGLLLFAIATSKWTLPARIIDNKVLVAVGVLTYAIYILHEGVIDTLEQFHWFAYTQTVGGLVFNMVLVLSVTVPLAWFLHKSVEMPWVDAGDLWEHDGRRKELYPHLVMNRTAADELFDRWMLLVHQTAGTHFGPSPASRYITRNLRFHAVTHAETAGTS